MKRLDSQSFLLETHNVPQIALDVITSRWTTITSSISQLQRERGREREKWRARERESENVFSLAVVRPNGPSKMCTNQLAWLTLEMVCQPVNLEERRCNSYLCLTVKGGR